MSSPDPSPLAGRQRALLRDALVGAFGKRSDFDDLCREVLNVSVDMIIGNEGTNEIARQLVDQAEEQGVLRELCEAAVRNRPRNDRLRGVCAELGLIRSELVPRPPQATPTRRSLEGQGVGVGAGCAGLIARGIVGSSEPFVVPCPIDRGVRTKVRLRRLSEAPTTVRGCGDNAEWLRRALAVLGLSPAIVHCDEEAVSVHDGMGLGSARRAALLRALADAAGQRLDDDQVDQLVLDTNADGTLHTGAVAVHAVTGALLTRFEWVPSFWLVMVIPRLVRSIVQVAAASLAADGSEDTLAMLLDAAAARDPLPFAEAATETARALQKRRFNRNFRLACDMQAHHGAAGVAMSHAGPIVTLLFLPDARAAADAARRELASSSLDLVVEMATLPDMEQS